jgi:hypothetical protein
MLIVFGCVMIVSDRLKAKLAIIEVLDLGLRMYLGICWGCQKPSGGIREEINNKKRVLTMIWT